MTKRAFLDEYRRAARIALRSMRLRGHPDAADTENVEALEELEPCGAGCPRPVFCMEPAR
jgi:single-stranded DNA-specific DHH superfamily exonuclease